MDEPSAHIIESHQGGMNQTASRLTPRRLVWAVSIFCLVIAFLCWPSPNDLARRQLRASLWTTSLSPAEQLLRLSDVVRLGDDIDDVRFRLSPSPTTSPDKGRRPTEWAFGMEHVNLVLAIESDGRVVGIGRHIHVRDDGTVWFASPKWYHLAAK